MILSPFPIILSWQEIKEDITYKSYISLGSYYKIIRDILHPLFGENFFDNTMLRTGIFWPFFVIIIHSLLYIGPIVLIIWYIRIFIANSKLRNTIIIQRIGEGTSFLILLGTVFRIFANFEIYSNTSLNISDVYNCFFILTY